MSACGDSSNYSSDECSSQSSTKDSDESIDLYNCSDPKIEDEILISNFESKEADLDLYSELIAHDSSANREVLKISTKCSEIQNDYQQLQLENVNLKAEKISLQKKVDTLSTNISAIFKKCAHEIHLLRKENSELKDTVQTLESTLKKGHLTQLRPESAFENVHSNYVWYYKHWSLKQKAFLKSNSKTHNKDKVSGKNPLNTLCSNNLDIVGPNLKTSLSNDVNEEHAIQTPTNKNLEVVASPTTSQFDNVSSDENHSPVIESLPAVNNSKFSNLDEQNSPGRQSLNSSSSSKCNNFTQYDESRTKLSNHEGHHTPFRENAISGHKQSRYDSRLSHSHRRLPNRYNDSIVSTKRSQHCLNGSSNSFGGHSNSRHDRFNLSDRISYRKKYLSSSLSKAHSNVVKPVNNSKQLKNSIDVSTDLKSSLNASVNSGHNDKNFANRSFLERTDLSKTLYGALANQSNEPTNEFEEGECSNSDESVSLSNDSLKRRSSSSSHSRRREHTSSEKERNRSHRTNHLDDYNYVGIKHNNSSRNVKNYSTRRRNRSRSNSSEHRRRRKLDSDYHYRRSFKIRRLR